MEEFRQGEILLGEDLSDGKAPLGSVTLRHSCDGSATAWVRMHGNGNRGAWKRFAEDLHGHARNSSGIVQLSTAQHCVARDLRGDAKQKSSGDA